MMSMIVNNPMMGGSSHAAPQTLSFAKLLAARSQGPVFHLGRLSIVPVYHTGLPDTAIAHFPDALRINHSEYIGHIQTENTQSTALVIPAHTMFHMPDGSVQAMGKSRLLGAKDKQCIPDAARTSQKGGKGSHVPPFAILPFPLRKAAYFLEGVKGSTKLWGDICHFYDQMHNLPHEDLGYFFEEQTDFFHLHLKQIPSLPEQTGAIFFWDGKWMGLELESSATNWASRAREIYRSYLSSLLLPRHQPEDPQLFEENKIVDQVLPQRFRTRDRVKDRYNHLLEVEEAGVAGEVLVHSTHIAFASLINPSLSWW